jgi:shikimate dehydrogenase
MSGCFQFGLLGHRISYSLSPDIFRAIADHTNCHIDFSLIDIPGDKLDITIEELVHQGLDGFSVTIPHKSRLLKLVTDIDPVAETIGAVNSVKVSEGSLIGYNTDVFGFAVPLEEFREELRGKTAIIVGSGGAARAVLYSLLREFEVNHALVCARTVARVTQLQADAARFAPDREVSTCLLSDFAGLQHTEAAILVNCTPLGGFTSGGAPIEAVPFPVDIAPIYYDLNYNADNLLIANAYREGVRAIDGTKMLVGQAVRSFELWTGLTVPFDAVYNAVFGRRFGEHGEWPE